MMMENPKNMKLMKKANGMFAIVSLDETKQYSWAESQEWTETLFEGIKKDFREWEENQAVLPELEERFYALNIGKRARYSVEEYEQRRQWRSLFYKLEQMDMTDAGNLKIAREMLEAFLKLYERVTN